MKREQSSQVQKPGLSVIMPCYNAEASVARAIASVQAQTEDDWELIVVDDGSHDSSAEIVKGISTSDPRIRLIRRAHEGVVAASNAGFSFASAPLIARMDADDVSRPDRLEKQRDTLGANPELGAVTCRAKFMGDTVAAAGYAHHVDWINRYVTPEQIGLNRFVDLPFPHPTLMYRRELIDRHGGYRNGAFPEDYELFLRWVAAGVRVGKVDEALYDWHDPPTRLSRIDSRYDMTAFHQCKAPYLAQAIRESGCADRELWIWGAGRPARKCARPLESAWKTAAGFIDIDPRKIGRVIHGRPVVAADDIPLAKQAVIVSFVGTRGARDSIRDALLAMGRIEGTDFWLCA